MARRVALMLARSISRLAAMSSAPWSGAFAATARRKLSPGPWVKRCLTLLPPPGSGSIRYRHDADGRAVLGLHFGGSHAQQNWAHSLERITPELAPFMPGGPDE